jgi:aerobic-type carbon monoxide dehydrogenase small subunit (CoxS/CutS family)
MSKKEKKPDKRLDNDPVGLSRREFLKDAGFVIGGATLGSMALLTACGGPAGTETVTKTVTSTTTSTVGAGATVTQTVTSTVGAGQTATVTTTVPGAGPEGMVHLAVNGIDYWGKVEPNWTLAYVLREKLGLTGTKRGCKEGACGYCTVIMDGRPVLSCLILAIEADGLPISTIEGLAEGDTLHPLQQAFIDKDALQCGFCTPAMIMNAKALLDYKANPTVAEIKEFMAGTVCRCGCNKTIIEAIQQVAG